METQEKMFGSYGNSKRMMGRLGWRRAASWKPAFWKRVNVYIGHVHG